MPQMGESIAEGTVSKWLKAVGDTVERDEPILEISTDKVDAEIPAPASGTLVEVAVQEGETVEVGTIVAFIDPEGGAPVAAATAPAEAAAPAAQAAPAAPATPSAPAAAAPAASSADQTAEERLRTRSTPVVRKIAEEHRVDIASVAGTGHAGRVTKQDILDHIAAGPATAPAAPPAAPAAPAPPAPAPAAPAATRAPAPAGGSDFWSAFYKTSRGRASKRTAKLRCRYLRMAEKRVFDYCRSTAERWAHQALTELPRAASLPRIAANKSAHLRQTLVDAGAAEADAEAVGGRVGQLGAVDRGR